ncbi:MAG: hypothetical protein DWQ04_29335 [Chloroflexi bacterium]|nr:MAG: hypothetical protein DWQ04_29335 [Chloroflexota bacterium]
MATRENGYTFTTKENIQIVLGTNYISLPVTPINNLKAHDFCDLVENQDRSIGDIAKDPLNTYSCEQQSGTNFSMEIGEGYFVDGDSQIFLEIEGVSAPTVTLNLALDDNWVGIPQGINVTAASLCSKAGEPESEVEISYVNRWKSGGWVAYECNAPTPGDDFTLKPGVGYSVLVTSEGSLVLP